MATISEVKQGLDAVAEKIASARNRFEASKVAIQNNSSTLGQIPTAHSDVLTTIDGYAPSGAFETLAKDEKAKLQTEFVALKADIDALIASF